MKHLTLYKAIKSGRLDEFVKQQETAGTGPASINDFDLLIETASKPRQSADQTSGSSSRDGSRGK